jgi:Zn finger protein HypA/HybF involved in hydrogenase expression
MKTLIKVDPNTIRKNPNAGQSSFLVPGIVRQDEQGNFYRDVQTVHTLTPEPAFFFSYIDTNVTCEGCGDVFSYKELKSDVDAEDENYNTCICPKCGKWDCCDIESETLKEVS